MRAELEQKRRAAGNRLSETRLRIGPFADEDGGEEAAQFASPREDLGQLLGEARRVASGETEQLTGLLLAFLEDRVDVGRTPAETPAAERSRRSDVADTRWSRRHSDLPSQLELCAAESRDASVDHQMISSVFDTS
jgi:hypothetical protein